MKIIDSFNTTSDRGGVLIGNEDWQLLVPNGYGDGTTYIHIMQFKDFKEQFDYVREMEKIKEANKLRFWYSRFIRYLWLRCNRRFLKTSNRVEW